MAYFEQGDSVVVKRGKFRGRFGLIYRSHYPSVPVGSQRLVVQLGASGPFWRLSNASLRPATEDEQERFETRGERVFQP